MRKSLLYFQPFAFLTLVATAADLNRGIELYRSGKYSDAVSELRQVVKDSSDNAAAQRYLGLSLLSTDNVNEAAEHIQKANEMDQSGENKAALARLYVEQKDWGKAEEALNGASGSEADYARGLLQFNRQQWEESAKSFESALDKESDLAYAHYYAGLAYNSMRRPDKMLTHFELFLKMRPDAPEAKKVRAVLRTGR